MWRKFKFRQYRNHNKQCSRCFTKSWIKKRNQGWRKSWRRRRYGYGRTFRLIYIINLYKSSIKNRLRQILILWIFTWIMINYFLIFFIYRFLKITIFYLNFRFLILLFFKELLRFLNLLLLQYLQIRIG